MSKIPFNIKFRPQIESGEYKVETRNGMPVEIVKWDLRSPHGRSPILAIIHEDYDYNRTYSDEGYATIDSDRLFIVTPEEEMTPFEKGFLERVFHQKAEDLDEQNKEIFLEDARCVLELARKQLKQEIRAEALKDLPRWKKAIGNFFVEQSIMHDEHGFYISCVTKPGCRYITCDALAKLPGFND